MYPYIYSRLIFDKEVKIFSKKKKFFQNGARKTWVTIFQIMKMNTNLTSLIKITSKWFKDL